MINKILFVTLSNIGDVILSLPVLDVLKRDFPQAQITIIVGPRPKEIFENNPCIQRLIIYDKHCKLREKIKLFSELKKEKFDLVVDLKNSFLGAALLAKYRTLPFLKIPKEIRHMRDRHLYKLIKAIKGYPKSMCLKTELSGLAENKTFYTKPEDEAYISKILKDYGVTDKDKIIVISAGARSHIKRWPADRFLELIPGLIEEFKAKIILVGDKGDVSITRYIAQNSKYPILDLAGKTSISELGCLLKKADCVITCDSAVLHLASYLDVPIVAIFGPTSELKYGPWSKLHAVVKKDIFCRPCENAQCKFGTLRCMQLIKAEDVLRRVRDILNFRISEHQDTKRKDDFSRILIVRTDRIGDLLLSTPVIKALRDNYPSAYIAAMVSPYAKDVVDGNPYLDEVIVYDKDGKHKSWMRSIKFSCNLKKKKFDLALILHPTNRVHLIAFFAGIPKRIGYNRKMGFLLTDRLKHTKQYGEKHELEYNLDFLSYLGIEAKSKNLFMPIKLESEKWVEDLFRQEGINPSDRLLAIHPGASCPSKIWPNKRFAEVADKLIERYKFKVLIVAGPKDVNLAQGIVKNMQQPVINLAGRTSVSQLASLLKRCQLFISNDSGPVHIASAVGTPVISIFGRNQAGLGPRRWGPQGIKDRILHKNVGCLECLAHNCKKEFICLKAITVDEVIAAAESILS